MKKIISAKRIMSEYNKHAKIKIDMRGAKILQEEARRHAEENDCDAHIEISGFETKDGRPYIIR